MGRGKEKREDERRAVRGEGVAHHRVALEEQL